MLKRILLFVSGLLILTIASTGIFYSLRASCAQQKYYTMKHTAVREDPEAVFEYAEEIFELTPYNYHACIFTAEMAQYNRMLNGKEFPERRYVAEKWCDRGLKLNIYKSQLRRLKTRLLAEKSVPAAIKYWEDYVDWDFWKPANHYVLVELYAENGEFAKAFKSLTWVEPDKTMHDRAFRKLYLAMKK